MEKSKHKGEFKINLPLYASYCFLNIFLVTFLQKMALIYFKLENRIKSYFTSSVLSIAGIVQSNIIWSVWWVTGERS